MFIGGLGRLAPTIVTQITVVDVVSSKLSSGPGAEELARNRFSVFALPYAEIPRALQPGREAVSSSSSSLVLDCSVRRTPISDSRARMRTRDKDECDASYRANAGSSVMRSPKNQRHQRT